MIQQSIEEQLDILLSEDVHSAKLREDSIFDQLSYPFRDSLILFGAGNLGRKTLTRLRKIGIEPKAFSDNNPALWNTFVDGLEVVSPDEAARKYRDKATFVITIWRALGEDRQARRREQLLNLNCQKMISFGYLYWKYPDIFLPHYALDEPYKLLEQSYDIRRLFYLWVDDSSKQEYLAQLRFRMLLDFDGLPSPVAHKQYFADDLFSINNDEVFVDVGAFDGDTVKEFLHRQSYNFNRVVALEPDLINFTKLERYISTLPVPIRNKVSILRIAAVERREKVRFDAKGTVQSSVSNTGNIEVDCAPLDEILEGQSPTFLKMGIEGFEIDALLGGSTMIKKSVPILAICVYHRPDHLYRIPLLLHSWADQYRFFLRPHDKECWDLVCYAIHISLLTNPSSGRA
jgi:FkbM family methyltransferase